MAAAAHTLPVALVALLMVVGLALVVLFCMMHGPVTVPPTPVPPAHCALPITC